VYAADAAGTYAILRGTNNRAFRMQLYGARFIALDFSAQIARGACGTSTPPCFRTFDQVDTLTERNGADPWKAYIAINVVDANGNEPSTGLLSLGVNGPPAFGRAHVGFPDPDSGEFHYAASFHAVQYPGSDWIKVERTADCTWKFTAAETGVDGNGDPTGARGVLYAYSVGKGNRGSHEGVFSLPFQIIFSAPGCLAS
jgi:hypothetical protein